MAAALQATLDRRASEVRLVDGLRNRLADGLLGSVPGAVETGDRAFKVAGNCHIRFEGIESEALLFLLDDSGVCAAAGSACASGAMEPSHVLTAMGLHRPEGAVRFSLGHTSTTAEVDIALKAVPEAVARLREA